MTTASTSSGMVDPAIFEDLQSKIDEDSEVRDQLRDILQKLEKQGRHVQAILARAHSTPSSQLGAVLTDAEKTVLEQVETIRDLAGVANKHPYYKYNGTWTRDMQNVCFAVLFCSFLGGFQNKGELRPGTLRGIDDVGRLLKIPVNLKDKDGFHLSLDEYLHATITLVDEVSRLAVNSVTHGDYERPLQIANFVKDVHSGFSILNLKNDSLRRRSDGLKYNVKKVEDVVYDLALRGLIPGR